MSLPIAAVGPLKVETKPILIVSAASAGCASARTVAPASQNAVFIFTPLLIISISASQVRRFSWPRPVAQPVFAQVILCAKSPARSKHEPKALLRTFGSYPSSLHHNSQGAAMARIIVQVKGTTIVAVAGGSGTGDPAGLKREFRPIDDIRGVAEIADAGDLAGRPVQQHEIFRPRMRRVRIEHQNGRTALHQPR